MTGGESLLKMGVAQGLENVEAALQAWLRKNLANGAELWLSEVRRPKSGFSAHTLLLKVRTRVGGIQADHEWVLRLERSGREIFPDADITRQGKMMRALGAHAIPVPKTLAVESDRAPLGGQFLVMERVQGHSLPQHPSYQVTGLLHDLDPEHRGAMWKDAVTTIGRINRLDWRDGFEFLDRPAYGAPGLGQYLAWLDAWTNRTLGGQPHRVIDAAVAYLFANRPSTAHVDVLWGDSNPGNYLFAQDGRVAAAHDFEASALGPGEIDLGWWFFIDELLSFGVPRLDGLPDRATQIKTYEDTVGRQVADLHYYEVLAGVRICLVVARTAQLLIGEGQLEPTSQAGAENPMVDVLGAKLGMERRGSMEHYMQLVAVMNRR
jgi:aminoglycoside phosphotransferase (APT) family kinase protein